MEEIDSSKELGSSTSAGIKLFKNSTVRVWSEFEAGRVEVGSGSTERDARRDGEASNLTVGLVYGRGRLHDGTFRTRNRC